MLASAYLKKIKEGEYEEFFKNLYHNQDSPKIQGERYSNAVLNFINLYGDRDVIVLSAPGRSEIAGNHTDHQQGMVIGASVNLDILAVASASLENECRVTSEGYGEIGLDISDMEPNDSETGTTAALIRGMASGLKNNGFKVEGFDAYITSSVPAGSGLSSSAAFEVLLGNLIFRLYNPGEPDKVLIAKLGQEAENRFFGKPCGLLDQMSSAFGGLVFIDFKDPKNPCYEPLAVDFESFGVCLCIVDTKGSHADLTPDYAAIPAEMKGAASVFGKEVLREVDPGEFMSRINEVRDAAGDRAVLRALHFFGEQKRVPAMVSALKQGDFTSFLQFVRESGASSYDMLQNVYSPAHTRTQGVSLGISLAKEFLGEGAAVRVHGGGFAGTIQAYVKNEEVSSFKTRMEAIFGEGACHVVKIRQVGGAILP